MAMFEGGIHPTPLRDAAWRSFLVSGVAGDLPFALHARLAGIYGAQERLDFMHRTTVGGAARATRGSRDARVHARHGPHGQPCIIADVVDSEERPPEGISRRPSTSCEAASRR